MELSGYSPLISEEGCRDRRRRLGMTTFQWQASNGTKLQLLERSSLSDIINSISTLNTILNDAVVGCSKPFAVRMVRNTLANVKGLQGPFLSELADHLYLKDKGKGTFAQYRFNRNVCPSE